MTFVERYQELRGMNDDKNVKTTRRCSTCDREKTHPAVSREKRKRHKSLMASAKPHAVRTAVCGFIQIP